MLGTILLISLGSLVFAAWYITRGHNVPTTSEKSRGEGKSKSPAEMNLSPTLHAILDLARWSPSGDNEQPWQFEVINESHIRVHYRAPVKVYDADSHTQQLALGALLETIKIAASKFGLATECIRDPSQSGDYKKTGICYLLFDIKFKLDSTIQSSPLASSIESRVTQRKWMSTRQLTNEEKTRLRECLNGSSGEPNSTFTINFRESLSERWSIANVMYRTANIRMSMPEAFSIHVNSLEWHSSTSIDRMPIDTVCLDSVTKSIMYWGMLGGWKRMNMMNQIAGHATSRVQMELIPGMMCASHVIISVAKQPTTVDDWIESGRCLGRFWLTLTHLGLRMQPEIVPLVFARYVRTGVKPSTDVASQDALVELEKDIKKYIETKPDGTPMEGFPVIMARCGQAKEKPVARSMRRPLEDLMYTQ